jgi:hypothetical protein
MVDPTATQAQAKGVAPSAVASPLSVPSPPSADGVDKLYRQLAAIHAIATAQLAECAYWRRSDSTASPIHAGADWQRLAMEPFTEG